MFCRRLIEVTEDIKSEAIAFKVSETSAPVSVSRLPSIFHVLSLPLMR